MGGQVIEAALDSSGNAYVVFYSSADNTQQFIRKYTPSGTFVWQRQFTIPNADGSGYHASDVDAQNNVYLTFAISGRTELRKYSSNGTLLYNKQLTGVVYDLAVAPDGTTYTVANQQRFTRYTSQGQQVWQNTIPFVARMVSLGASSQVYVGGRVPLMNLKRAVFCSLGTAAVVRSTGSGPFSKASSRTSKGWTPTCKETSLWVLTTEKTPEAIRMCTSIATTRRGRG